VAGLRTLIVASADPLPRLLLLAWVLISAGWIAVTSSRGYGGTRWWGVILLAPATPVVTAVFGAVRIIGRLWSG
jgi:hypothetical protein